MCKTETTLQYQPFKLDSSHSLRTLPPSEDGSSAVFDWQLAVSSATKPHPSSVAVDAKLETCRFCPPLSDKTVAQALEPTGSHRCHSDRSIQRRSGPPLCYEVQKGQESFYRGNYADVDLDVIQSNCEVIRNYKQGVDLFAAVIKANAYGHGAIPLARHLLRSQCVDAFVVITVEEALDLRRADIMMPILVVSGSFVGAYEAVIQNSLTPVIGNITDLVNFSQAGIQLGCTVTVHVEVDVGMARLGFRQEDITRLGQLACKLDNIIIKGCMAHPSHSALDADSINHGQESAFSLACNALGPTIKQRTDEHPTGSRSFSYSSSTKSLGSEAHGTSTTSSGPRTTSGSASERSDDTSLTTLSADQRRMTDVNVRHFINSASVACPLSTAHSNMARIGLALYGIQPVLEHPIPGLLPGLSWYASVVAIRTLKVGDTVGYNGGWRASRTTKVATICVGYADGYPRSLSNKAQVLVNGRRANVIGKICELTLRND